MKENLRGDDWLWLKIYMGIEQGGVMRNQLQQSDSQCGIWINSGRYGAKDYPSWATPAQREKWRDRGLIVWEGESQQIVRLRAGQAIQLLKYLRTNDDWKSQGFTLGEPTTRLVLEEPDRDPENVLLNQIKLDPTQSQELFDYLRINETRLRELDEIEEKERRERLGKVCSFIIERGRRNRALAEGKTQLDGQE